MATLSTNTNTIARPQPLALKAMLARLVAAVTTTPRSAEDHLAAAARREAARARVDYLLR